MQNETMYYFKNVDCLVALHWLLLWRALVDRQKNTLPAPHAVLLVSWTDHV